MVLKAFTTVAPFAHLATCSPPLVSPLRRSPDKSGLSGFVQSMSIFPSKLSPKLLMTDSVPDQGVAITIISLLSTACFTKDNLACSFKELYFSSSRLRSP